MGFVHPVHEGMLHELKEAKGLALDPRGNVQGSSRTVTAMGEDERTVPRYSDERKEAVLRKMLPPHNRSLSALAAEEITWLRSLAFVRTSFCQHLHAECYLNERAAIITPMNLYDFSQVNNNEMGIHVDREQEPRLYRGTYEEAQRLIRISEEVRLAADKVEPTAAQDTARCRRAQSPRRQQRLRQPRLPSSPRPSAFSPASSTASSSPRSSSSVTAITASSRPEAKRPAASSACRSGTDRSFFGRRSWALADHVRGTCHLLNDPVFSPQCNAPARAAILLCAHLIAVKLYSL